MDTICAIATASGQGAVGMVRLSGPEASVLLERATGRSGYLPRRMQVADILDPDSAARVDQGMVCVMPGPHSYTGEDVVEVYGHGGALNMDALLRVFLRLGARQAEPGEFTRRAFVNGRMDLTQAEAVAEVIAARSERALGNAQALLAGELGHKVRALRQQTIELAADLEACLDFAEDIEAPVGQQALQQAHVVLLEQLERLIRTHDRAKRLSGVDVALVGPVNGGKSSLFNALLGRRRALVSQQEGTTRDYLEAEVAWDGLAITLIDTAGERPPEAMSGLERDGRELGCERTAHCDMLVHVVDLVNPGDSQFGQEQVPGQQDRPALLAANKVDLLTERESIERCAALEQTSGLAVVPTSAETGAGLDSLREHVLARVLGDESMDEQLETVQVSQKRQVEALQRAAAALSQGLAALRVSAAPELVVEHTREALTALGAITGETYTEDVLDAVFARFCIGK